MMILQYRRNGLHLLASGVLLLLTAAVLVNAFAPVPAGTRGRIISSSGSRQFWFAQARSDDEEPSSSSTGVDDRTNSPAVEVQRAPTLNGKMVLPFKVMNAGLQGHTIAAVYAVLNSQYKRGSGEGWEHCEYVGVTRNLEASLQSHLTNYGPESVAHVRALSFSYPQRTAMEEVASQWRDQVTQAAGGSAFVSSWNTPPTDMTDNDRKALIDIMERSAVMDDDDDDDDDEFEDDNWRTELPTPTLEVNEATTEAVISPFSSSETETPLATGENLLFTRENVDRILEEVRPYLIADGGNVSVQRVDEDTKNVYLLLEGACGSCPSSTVTMQMGIERVLKENFPDLGQVVQVEDPATVASKPTELTWKAVEDEVRRIQPAIVAMGGVIRIVSVDPIGVVEIEFRGSNKVRQGLELALQDVPFVKHVKFVM